MILGKDFARSHTFCASELVSSIAMEAGSLFPFLAVCMFIEESKLGQRFWRSNLMPLLNCIAATFSLMLEDQTDRNEQKHYITVKVNKCAHESKPTSFDTFNGNELKKEGTSCKKKILLKVISCATQEGGHKMRHTFFHSV